MVFFVNYEDIMEQVREIVQKYSPSCSAGTPLSKGEQIWFYSSDYSDIQWMDSISSFNETFIPFFESLDGVNMEIRTKSANIKSLLQLGFVPKNTEIAFSLNPQELITRYESWTASLEKRYEAIHTLLEAWFRVGIRLLPLLPVKDFREIYSQFFENLRKNIPLEKISSSFASWLLYTREDYKVMLKKYPGLDILHYLNLEDDNFYRESREVRDWFYTNIKQLDTSCLLCLES
jgi:spore photoproduct lyase